VIVVGDVNSTLAAAMAAVKLHIPVAHVEAGLRSYDRTMPEEINRLLTDQISDYLFTPSPDADDNLKREGIPPEKIFFVGNVMIDSLLYNKPLAEKSDILQRLGLITNHQSAVTEYALLTLHRPGNVDEKDSLTNIMTAITAISQRIPVVFPAHPRTRKKLEEFGLLDQSPVTSHQSPITNHRLLIIPPLGYLDFLKLEMYARFVMTDSGGIQEETTVLNVPCLTLRDTTERPITITQGTNVLVGNSPQRIIAEASRILDTHSPITSHQSPALWDGITAERIVATIVGREYNDMEEGGTN
jgi:UDP-N-acetylglucosamine 2-epimerase (non-hydrolysing)